MVNGGGNFTGPGFISYDLENDAAFNKKVNEAIKQVGNLVVPFRAIANDFRKSRRAIFALSGPGRYPDFQGKKIGELRKSPMQQARANAKPIPESANSMTPYQYRKQKKYGLARGYPLLKATGRLEKSLTEAGGENITIIERTALLMGSSVPYGQYHQSDSPRRKIPLRKYLFIGPEAGNVSPDRGTLDRWVKIISQYVKRVTGSTFGQSIGGSDAV